MQRILIVWVAEMLAASTNWMGMVATYAHLRPWTILPDLVYANQALSLEVIQSDANPSQPSDFAVYLILARNDRAGLSLIVYYENQLDALLRHVVHWQDQVSPTNFREFVRGVVQLCPQTFVLVNDQPMKLVEDVPVNALQFN